MTVRLPPSESDSAPSPQVPSPPDPGVTPVTSPDSLGPDSGASASGNVAPEVAEPSGTDSRIALRDARRQRRRTAWLCAAVVAISLGLTIVVVSLARTRPAPGPGVVVSFAVPVPSTALPGSTPLPTRPPAPRRQKEATVDHHRSHPRPGHHRARHP